MTTRGTCQPVGGMADAALQYATRRRRVLPIWWLRADGACACGGLPSCRPGKHPIPRHGVHNATTDAATIRAWWTRWPTANVAMAMGDGVVALDVDPRNGGDVTGLDLPATPTARTGGGGWHYLYAVEGEFRSRKLGPGLEIIGDGSYILVAPSRTVGPYEIISGGQPAKAPQWMYARIGELTRELPKVPNKGGPSRVPVGNTTSKRDALAADGLSRKDAADLFHRASAYLATMAPGIQGSHGSLATYLAALKMVNGFGLSTDDALRLLVEEYNPRCIPPWSLRELRHKVYDAANARSPPHWLAASPGTDPWSSAIRVTVTKAKFQRLGANGVQPACDRVRLWVATLDGEVKPRQSVVLGTKAYAATLPDVPSDAWLDKTRVASLESSLVGRVLEIVIKPGERKASRVRRVET